MLSASFQKLRTQWHDEYLTFINVMRKLSVVSSTNLLERMLAHCAKVICRQIVYFGWGSHTEMVQVVTLCRAA